MGKVLQFVPKTKSEKPVAKRIPVEGPDEQVTTPDPPAEKTVKQAVKSLRSMFSEDEVKQLRLELGEEDA